jgi:hypothetical protein
MSTDFMAADPLGWMVAMGLLTLLVFVCALGGDGGLHGGTDKRDHWEGSDDE